LPLWCADLFYQAVFTNKQFSVKQEKNKDRVFQRCQKHFLRISVISFEVILFSILFTIFMLIVTVPAVAITRSFLGGKTELLALTFV